jgi:acyl-CoA synthetase (AMP-forming)/AMP-acid ligase II
MLINNFLENSAARLPEKVALIHENTYATYAQINNMANSLARWLISRQTEEGRSEPEVFKTQLTQQTKYPPRVVLLLENSLEYVASYYGVLKAGAVAVPLSTDLKPDGLRSLLEELEPEIIISSSRFERLLQATDISGVSLDAVILSRPGLKWPSAGFKIISLEELFSDLTNDDPRLPVKETGLASIIYTSGSTGKPKGVMLTHRNIVSNTRSICQYLELTEDDIQMIVLPFFYVMGKSLLNTHFASGGTAVINNRFAYPATVVKQMEEEKITGFSGVPSTYAYLLHRSPLAKYRDRLASLRYCSQAGGHMSRQIKAELRRTLPEHTSIYIMYGATEASARLTYLEPDKFNDKIESIGKPIPGVSVRVLNDKGQELPAGEQGELVGAGPNIMEGYWKDVKATEAVLDENGYHTGDLGYQDEEGYLYVAGRRDGMLKVGGHRINIQEIEDVIMETELVTEAAVLGIQDKLLGNKLIAIVVPKNEHSNRKKILSSCSKKLPKYKLPGEVQMVRSIPKSMSGKIDRSKCLELATQ